MSDDNSNKIEIIKEKLYFSVFNETPQNSSEYHYFSIDEKLVYDNFYVDFGPLNLANLYKFCRNLNSKLKSIPEFQKIIFYTSLNPQKQANAAFLIGGFQILILNRTVEEVFKILTNTGKTPYLAFRDASYGPSTYNLTLLDCLHGLHKAFINGFFNLKLFNLKEHEHYEKVENGDFNWIIPGKFIAFCGPYWKNKVEAGYPLHSPESYFPYFRRNNVTDIVRLNKKVYDSTRFIEAGFQHHDLFFSDGTTPSDEIALKFLEIVDLAKGVIAVHCKAGLGRTGTLIACYIMKKYRFTAAETIAWIRLCRPGSIIGPQQNWLEQKQLWCWRLGDVERNAKTTNEIEFLKSENKNIKITEKIQKSVDSEDITGEKDDPVNFDFVQNPLYFTNNSKPGKIFKSIHQDSCQLFPANRNRPPRKMGNITSTNNFYSFN